MFGFGKKEQTLNSEKKASVLKAVAAQVRAGNTSSLRTMIAESIGPGVSGDDKQVSALLGEISTYGLPEDEKKKGISFHEWWERATAALRSESIDTAAAWITSR